MAIATAVLPLVAGAAVDSGTVPNAAPVLPDEVWAVSIGREQIGSVHPALLRSLHANGINTLVVNTSGVKPHQLHRIRHEAAAADLALLTPISSPRLGLFGPKGAASQMCRVQKARYPKRFCSVAASIATARRLAQEPNVDAVVADVGGPRDARYLRGINGTARVVEVAKTGRADIAAWRYAMTIAHSDAALDLGIAPAVFHSHELDWYFRLLGSIGVGEGPPLHVSPTGSDTGPCTKTTPCASFDRAYRLAEPGGTVEVGCGVYTSQTIRRDPNKARATAYVKFVAAPGCTPSVGSRTELAADYHGTETTIFVASTSGFAVGGTNSILVGSAWTVRCSGETETAFTGCTTESGQSPHRSEGDYFRAGAEVAQSGGLSVSGARRISFDGVDADGMSVVNDSAGHQPEYIRFLNGSALGCYVSGGSHILFKNIVFGPKRGGNSACLISPYGPRGETGPFDLVFDRDTFTDINANACVDFGNNDCHDEAIYLRYANGLTIENSRFLKNWTYSLMVTRLAPLVGDNLKYYAQNVTIMNNFFGPATCKAGSSSTSVVFPCGYATASIHFNSAMHGPQVLRNWTVAYNTFATAADFSPMPAPLTSNLVWRANYGVANLACDPHWIFSHNVFTGRACGNTDTGSASFSVRDPLSDDLHVTAPGVVSGKGDPKQCPAADIDGRTRPKAPHRCSAGAEEVAKG